MGDGRTQETLLVLSHLKKNLTLTFNAYKSGNVYVNKTIYTTVQYSESWSQI